LDDGKLGRIYRDGEVIVREGEIGDRMYIVQSGRVRVTRNAEGEEIHLAELKEGDFFGELAIIEAEVRSATVRAFGDATLLSIDKKNFLRRVHEDPSLAYLVLQRLSQRIRQLTDELTELRARQ
jgi:CRP-like cAMP-binding protein